MKLQNCQEGYVVYQNDWVEPILCQVNHFTDEEIPYQYKPVINSVSQGMQKKYNKELIKLLLRGRTGEKLEPDLDFLYISLNEVEMSTKNKIGVRFLLDEYREKGFLAIWSDGKFGILSELVTELVCGKKTIESLISRIKNYDALNESMCDSNQ